MATVTEKRETPGEAIDRLCREQGRTKEWLAAQLGLSQSGLSNRIAGRARVRVLEARELGRIFDVPAETFLHDGDDSAPGRAAGSFS
jgi:plasmid maintenance system antidote protein VapI